MIKRICKRGHEAEHGKQCMACKKITSYNWNKARYDSIVQDPETYRAHYDAKNEYNKGKRKADKSFVIRCTNHTMKWKHRTRAERFARLSNHPDVQELIKKMEAKKERKGVKFKVCAKNHRYQVGDGCLVCRKIRELAIAEKKKPIALTDEEKAHLSIVAARVNKKAIQRAEMERKYPGYKG